MSRSKFPLSVIGYGFLGAIVGPLAVTPLLIAIVMHIEDDFAWILMFFGGVILAALSGVGLAARLRLQYLRADAEARIINTRRQLVAVSLLAAITVLAFLTIPDRTHGPDDDVMALNFQKHKPLFDTLLHMVNNDKRLEAVYENLTWPAQPSSVGVSERRISDYHALLHQVGSVSEQSGLRIQDDRQGFLVFCWSYGQGKMFAPMYHKGYAYLARPPKSQETRQSLNDVRPSGRVSFYYRHIEGNWYLFYEYQD